MSTIHSGQGVKANWAVAMSDGKVTTEEVGQIIDAAKASGVTRKERREALEVLESASATQNRLGDAHSAMVRVMVDAYERGEQMTPQQQAQFDATEAASTQGLANNQAALKVMEGILGPARPGPDRGDDDGPSMPNFMPSFMSWGQSMFEDF